MSPSIPPFKIAFAYPSNKIQKKYKNARQMSICDHYAVFSIIFFNVSQNTILLEVPILFQSPFHIMKNRLSLKT